MVGILVSFWDGLFSGAMLVSGRVDEVQPDFEKKHKNQTRRIHGTGIFYLCYHKNEPNVGKYAIHVSCGK